jgi:hypothetical protein
MDKITLPTSLPENQQLFLNNLINECSLDVNMYPAYAVLHVIQSVESQYPGKGQEVLKGAHIVSPSHAMYNDLIANQIIEKRASSHYISNGITDEGLYMPGTSDFLIGMAEASDGSIFSWLQLEKHKVFDGLMKSPILAILHVWDFFKYKWTGQNVGPCGLSKYTDKNPIRINWIGKK